MSTTASKRCVCSPFPAPPPPAGPSANAGTLRLALDHWAECLVVMCPVSQVDIVSKTHVSFVFVEEPVAVAVSPTHIAVSCRRSHGGWLESGLDIQLFLADTHVLLRRISGVEQFPASLNFSHDGTALLLCVRRDAHLCLCSVETGEIVKRLAPYELHWSRWYNTSDFYIDDAAPCPGGGWITVSYGPCSAPCCGQERFVFALSFVVEGLRIPALHMYHTRFCLRWGFGRSALRCPAAGWPCGWGSATGDSAGGPPGRVRPRTVGVDGSAWPGCGTSRASPHLGAWGHLFSFRVFEVRGHCYQGRTGLSCALAPGS